MVDDKRTKIGQAAPVRQTGAQPVVTATAARAAVSPNPTPAPAGPGSQPPGGYSSGAAPTTVLPPGGTPAPITGAPASGAHSYLPPQADPLIGQTLAQRYYIQKKLGEGGMGAVYLATHNLLEKQVALKVLHGEFARKPDLVERFMQEAKAASRIRHENVIDISDFGSTGEGLVFFAMELLKGHDLHEEIARARLSQHLLPWSRTKKIFLQICSALSAAHAQGIIHRDLKPENVYLVEFLGEPDFVKLLDFGIAKLTESAEGDRKLTRTGMLFGTPEYMSPEQARGEQVDHRVDVYAMGCILFQLVTGRVPFEADNFMGVLSLHLTEPPPQIPVEVFDSIGAPRELAMVIDKALEKDRNARWSSIDELARAVRAACGEKITAPVPVQVAPSVAAPRQTTTTPAQRAATPTPAYGTPTTDPGAAFRQKTQWTGSLNVPEAAEGEPPKKSKAPLIALAVIIVGGGAGAAAFFATRGNKGTPATDPTGSAGSGSAVVTQGSAAPQPQPPAPPPPTPPPPSEPLPEWSQISLDSAPHGATVTDLATGKPQGTTPIKFKLHGSTTSRQFQLHLSGYSDSVVELTPDHPKIEYTETLEKGVGGGSTPHVHKVTTGPVAGTPGTGTPGAGTPGTGTPGTGTPGTGTPGTGTPGVGTPAIKPPGDTGAVTRPDTGETPAIKPPDVKPPDVAKPPDVKPPGDDDCGDPPCLKADPTRQH